MAVSDMVKQGQKEILQTDNALKRTQKIVEDTIQVSSAPAWPLNRGVAPSWLVLRGSSYRFACQCSVS